MAPETIAAAGPVGISADTLVAVRDLEKYFPIMAGVFSRHVADVKAVDGVTFDIKRGETLGLVGESGSGKTTLGRCILRLVEPTKGKIYFEGGTVDVTSLKRNSMRHLRREMQIIFQDPYASLNPRMTVGDIIAEPLQIHKLAFGKDVDARVNELLRTVGLAPYHANRYPHEFSGGQRQRIGVARALAVNPKFIVADEPVSALDVSIRPSRNPCKISRMLGLTYLFIAHDLSVVRHISDRGRHVCWKAHGAADRDELYERPLHPYTQSLRPRFPIPDPRIGARRGRISGRRSLAGPSTEQLPLPHASRSRSTMRDRIPNHRLRRHWVACRKVEELKAIGR